MQNTLATSFACWNLTMEQPSRHRTNRGLVESNSVVADCTNDVSIECLNGHRSVGFMLVEDLGPVNKSRSRSLMPST